MVWQDSLQTLLFDLIPSPEQVAWLLISLILLSILDNAQVAARKRFRVQSSKDSTAVAWPSNRCLRKLSKSRELDTLELPKVRRLRAPLLVTEKETKEGDHDGLWSERSCNLYPKRRAKQPRHQDVEGTIIEWETYRKFFLKSSPTRSRTAQFPLRERASSGPLQSRSFSRANQNW